MRFAGRRPVFEPNDPPQIRGLISTLRRGGLLAHPLHPHQLVVDGPLPPGELMRACLATWRLGPTAALFCGSPTAPFQFDTDIGLSAPLSARPAWILPWMRAVAARVPAVSCGALIAAKHLPARRNRALLPHLPGLAARMTAAARLTLHGLDPLGVRSVGGCDFTAERGQDDVVRAYLSGPGFNLRAVGDEPLLDALTQEAGLALGAFGAWMEGADLVFASVTLPSCARARLSAHELLDNQLILALPFAEAVRRTPESGHGAI